MTASVIVPLAIFWIVALGIFLYGWTRYLRPGRIYAQLADPFGTPAGGLAIPGREALVKWMNLLGRRIQIGRAHV